ncbi:MAG: hypothetical protein IJP44_12115 [Bacteroidales bacterium]|nr:hypothetical protein [Bacteroidales bacterium]
MNIRNCPTAYVAYCKYNTTIKATLFSLPPFYANCPDSPAGNKAKNALSLAKTICLDSGKNTKKMVWAREKWIFFVKMLAGWKNVCNFAVSKSVFGYPGKFPARGKPLSTLPKTKRSRNNSGSFYFPFK